MVKQSQSRQGVYKHKLARAALAGCALFVIAGCTSTVGGLDTNGLQPLAGDTALSLASDDTNLDAGPPARPGEQSSLPDTTDAAPEAVTALTESQADDAAATTQDRKSVV